MSPASVVALDDSIARRVEAARAAAEAAVSNSAVASESDSDRDYDTYGSSGSESDSDGSSDPARQPLGPAPPPPQPYSPGDVVCQLLGGPSPTTAVIFEHFLCRARAGLGIILSRAPRGAVNVCSQPSGTMVKHDPSTLAYGDGSVPGPPPPGSTHPTPHLGSAALLGQRRRGRPANPSDVTSPTLAPLTDAAVRVETNASMRGSMLTNDSTVYTTAGSFGLQFVEVDVPPGFDFSSFVVQTDSFGNFSPFVIEVFAGPNAGALVPVKVAHLPKVAARTKILSASDVFGFVPRVVKFRIVSWSDERTLGALRCPQGAELLPPLPAVAQVSNHDGGSSSMVKGIELYVTSAVANARWLQAGDRVRRAPTYTGDGWSLGGSEEGRVGLVLQVRGGWLTTKRLHLSSALPLARRLPCLLMGPLSSGASS